MDSGQHAASINAGKIGVLHGAMMHLMSDDNGQITPAHSISAGLDYPGVGPEHSFFADNGLATYVSVNDDEALNGFRVLSETEGIIPALESAHAIAHSIQVAPNMDAEQILVVNLSGRGDKDATEATTYISASQTGFLQSSVAMLE